MLRIEDALQLILDQTPLLTIEEIGLADAVGRVLRCEVKADADLPPFDRARMDAPCARRIRSMRVAICLYDCVRAVR
jgi:molybdopterin biosynthesis enzyme